MGYKKIGFVQATNSEIAWKKARTKYPSKVVVRVKKHSFRASGEGAHRYYVYGKNRWYKMGYKMEWIFIRTRKDAKVGRIMTYAKLDNAKKARADYAKAGYRVSEIGKWKKR